VAHYIWFLRSQKLNVEASPIMLKWRGLRGYFLQQRVTSFNTNKIHRRKYLSRFFSNSGGLWAGAADGGRERGPSGWGSRVWGLPWPPNLEGGSRVAVGPAVGGGVWAERRAAPAPLARGGGRGRLGQVYGGAHHGDILSEARLERQWSVVADPAAEAVGDRAGGRGGGASRRRRRRRW
jgi:hypothetical protein